MTAPLTELAGLYATNTKVAGQMTANLTDAQWLYRAGETANGYWLLGHLTGYRYRVLAALGQADEPPAWRDSRFEAGAAPPTELDPSAAEVRAAFLEPGEALIQALRRATAAQLEADSGRELPTGGRSVEALAHFLYFHETYHLGQLSMLCRAQGLPTLGR